MPAFDGLKRASFAGLEFPVEEIAIDGGLRDHVHEYPHSPGGAPEKLGRRLYVFRMKAKFHNTFRSYGTNLYPRVWNQLRNKFEAGLSDDLVVPTLGTLKAYCFAWPEVATAKQRSGVNVDLQFREDLADSFLLNGLLGITDSGLSQAQKNLVAVRVDFEEDTTPGLVFPPDDDEKQTVLDLLDAIDQAINDVLAVQDQIELAGTLIDMKVERLLAQCRALDATITMRRPINTPLIHAARAVWSAAEERRRDIARRRSDIVFYTTPIPRMTVTDVSKAFFGDSTHSTEILQFNGLEDPFDIPKGTTLRLYRPQQIAA